MPQVIYSKLLSSDELTASLKIYSSLVLCNQDQNRVIVL